MSSVKQYGLIFEWKDVSLERTLGPFGRRKNVDSVEINNKEFENYLIMKIIRGLRGCKEIIMNHLNKA